MGILKNITDEYFEKTLRNEDGKYLDVDGCKVIVPIDFDKKMFLEEVQKTLSHMNCTFYSSETAKKYKESVEIECGNEYSMLCYTYSTLSQNISKYGLRLVIDETLYNSVIKYLRHIMKDLDIVENKIRGFTDYYIVMIDEKSFPDIDKVIKFGENSELSKLCEKFTKEFKKTVGSGSDLYITGRHGKSILLKVKDFMFSVDLNRIRRAKELREWWIKECTKIINNENSSTT